MVSKTQTLVLYILPMISGSISFLGSGTIAVVILISPNRFKTPYRRIVFGLSVMDTIQSLGMIIGPFAIPQGTEGALWAIGNTYSCDVQGFAVHIGFAGVPMYTLCLCLYYYFMIQLNMSESDFSKKVEPYLHAGAIAWTFIGGFICLSSKSFNVLEAGNMCWYTPLPADCVTNDEVECIRGSSAFTYGWIFGGSNFLTLCGIMYCLYAVCKCVADQERKNDRYRFRGSIAVPQEPQGPQGAIRRLSLAYSSFRDSDSHASIPRRMTQALSSLRRSTNDDPEDALAIYVARIERKSMERRKETTRQATYYIGAFLSTCIWAYLYGFLVTIGVKVPYAISVLLVLFYPMCGFLNLLVFTRPKVRTVRKRIKNISWIKAFYFVLRAGGSLPDESVLQSGSESEDRRASSNTEYRGSSGNLDATTLSPPPTRPKRRPLVPLKSGSEETKEELNPPPPNRRLRFSANVAKNDVHFQGCTTLEPILANVSTDDSLKEDFLPDPDKNDDEEKQKLSVNGINIERNKERDIKKCSPGRDDYSSSTTLTGHQSEDIGQNIAPSESRGEVVLETVPREVKSENLWNHTDGQNRSRTSLDIDVNNEKIEEENTALNACSIHKESIPIFNCENGHQGEGTRSQNEPPKKPETGITNLGDAPTKKNEGNEGNLSLHRIRNLLSVHTNRAEVVAVGENDDTTENDNGSCFRQTSSFQDQCVETNDGPTELLPNTMKKIQTFSGTGV